MKFVEFLKVLLYWW